MIRARMICATRRSEKIDNTAQMTMTPQLMAAIAPLLVTWLAALTSAWLWNAAPSAVSMNGVNVAAKWALADSTQVNTTAMAKPATEPATGDTMRDRNTYSPPARGMAAS